MLKRFSEIGMNDVSICGGKGASLGEMKNVGFPIPDGFVLTTKSFGKEQLKWEKEVLAAFDKLNTKFVAVRSSGTKEDGADDSFAGQFDTYLFVTRDTLIQKIKECHESVKSERILSYCKYKGIDNDSIKVAVVVQKMVNSNSAGVCFTVNPVSGNHNEIMIEAGYGVGEAVVSGIITPDNYIVNKKTKEVQKTISKQEKKLVLGKKGGTEEILIPEKEQEKQKLSDKYIQELAELAIKIEKHYGKPMDTEWAIENGKLFMLQARPITTLTDNEEKTELTLSEILDGAILVTGRNASVQRDILLGNCFLNNDYYSMRYWFAIPELGGGTGYYLNKEDYMKYSNAIADEFMEAGFFKIYKERNKKRYREYYDIYNKIYKDFSKKSVKINKEIIFDVENLFKYSSSVTTYYYYVLNVWAFENVVIPKFKTILENYFKNDYENIWKIITAQTKITNEQKFRIELAKLKKRFGSNIQKEKIESLRRKRRYLGRYNPEDYGYTKEIIKDMYNNVDVESTLSIPKGIKENKDNFELVLNQNKGEKRICEIMELINYNVYFRTLRMENFMSGYQLLFPMYNYLMEKLGFERNEVGNLTDDEIIQFLKNGITPPKRSSRPYMLYLPNGAKEFSEQEICIINKKLYHNYDIKEFGGDIAYKGNVIGKVKIINSEKDLKKVDVGDIMVSWFTRPEYIPSMKKAAAFITNDGGVTCHAAIVARELKKPCIIGTKIATKILQDGDLVEVDANNGVVKILN